MIYLSTTGYGYSKRLCEDVVCWFVSKYVSRYKLDIEVLHRGMKREGAWGWATVTDCDWRPRSFLIEIQSGLKKQDYIITILHEMQHILQHIRGDLRDKRGIRCWKGIDCSGLDYADSPWEIEAHSMESILLQEYLKDRHLTDL
jgi:hypothetical protein